MERILDTGPSSGPKDFQSSQAAKLLRRYHNIALFLGGFLFDCVTIRRIDSWLDIGFQLFYLGVLGALLVFQSREAHGIWHPPAFISSLWKYNVGVLHFLYGGLLNNYVILYFRSSSGARPFVFFLLLMILLIINEMPYIRRFGHRMRLGLYTFCLATFMIFFVPIMAGRMGMTVFVLSLLICGAIIWWVAGRLIPERVEKELRMRLFIPAAGVLGIIFVLYFLRLIPPVPLSVQSQGIYHSIEKTNTGYELAYLKPPLYLFWKSDSRPFRFRKGDLLYYWVSIFAPRNFRHRVLIRTEYFDLRSGKFVTSDTIPLNVVGGRDRGFRGFIMKSNYQAGRWRISSETEDGRTIGFVDFDAIPDDSDAPRQWLKIVM